MITVLHPGDLTLSEWLVVLIVWVIIPLVLAVVIVGLLARSISSWLDRRGRERSSAHREEPPSDRGDQ